MTSFEVGLVDRLLTEAVNHPRGDELRKQAMDLNRAIMIFATTDYDDPGYHLAMKRFVKEYDRACELWGEVIGDAVR